MNIYDDILPSHYLRKAPVFRSFRYRVRDLCASTTEEYHLVRSVVHHVEERLHSDGGAALKNAQTSEMETPRDAALPLFPRNRLVFPVVRELRSAGDCDASEGSTSGASSKGIGLIG